MAKPERISMAHPIVEDLMHKLQIGLPEDYPEPTHVHSYQVRRPWWQRLWFRFVRRWEWPYWEERTVRVTCAGVVTRGGPMKYRTEFDPDILGWKIVAWRQWECLEAIVRGVDPWLIRYAAVKVSQFALDSYRC